jgi:hypothetical protein
MKSGFTAATALALAIAASTASAGVVISQERVNQTGAQKTDQTVMVQGHKQKFIDGDREIVTDLDAGTVYIINPKRKEYFQSKFPPVGMLAMRMIFGGSTIELKKTGGTDKVAGYACQDYTGGAILALHSISVTQCVASDAPGAKEFAEFQKLLQSKLKGSPVARKGEIPDGIPLLSAVTTASVPFKAPPGFPPAAAEQMNAKIAGHKPTVINTTVSTIEVKDLPADTFAMPAGYTKGKEMQMPPNPLIRGLHSQPHGAAPAAGASAAPAAPAAPAPH